MCVRVMPCDVLLVSLVTVLYCIFIQEIQRVTKPLDIEHVKKIQYET
jgi:hypothetical protein